MGNRCLHGDGHLLGAIWYTVLPYMTQTLANTDFVEADVTFNVKKKEVFLLV